MKWYYRLLMSVISIGMMFLCWHALDLIDHWFYDGYRTDIGSFRHSSFQLVKGIAYGITCISMLVFGILGIGTPFVPFDGENDVVVTK
ncbi:hypothetical protein LCGC14_0970550 [marine sediment metagenome]|uniref:Uncharacterized protein n=1 Tax=marine sediment metagenome TaxID=412755 RepID=A0A0F9NBW5_9ZZZZ